MDLSKYLRLTPNEEVQLNQLPSEWKTRFAPSPSGYLHLGHLLHIIYTWGIAQKYHGKVLLRIEDHDLERSKSEYSQAIIEDLQWLGLPYEESEPQSARYLNYSNYLSRLKDQIYTCSCSRKTLKTYQSEDRLELWYRGDCRPNKDSIKEIQSKELIRWMVPDQNISFHDIKLGTTKQYPQEQSGDFSLRDRRGNYTYQYCVVHDDLMDDIDLVIRGEDIFESTGRQILFREALQKLNAPKTPPKELQFYHHPIIKDKSGNKLSKTDFAKSLRDWRGEGFSPEELIRKAFNLI